MRRSQWTTRGAQRASSAQPAGQMAMRSPKLGERIREKLGFGHHLLHDVDHRLTPIGAGRLGKDLEPCRLCWMEDATPAENEGAFRLIRKHATTPLAVGE